MYMLFVGAQTAKLQSINCDKDKSSSHLSWAVKFYLQLINHGVLFGAGGKREPLLPTWAARQEYVPHRGTDQLALMGRQDATLTVESLEEEAPQEFVATEDTFNIHTLHDAVEKGEKYIDSVSKTLGSKSMYFGARQMALRQ